MFNLAMQICFENVRILCEILTFYIFEHVKCGLTF